jgi:hypothetical protein
MSGGYSNRYGESRDQSTFTLSGGTLNQGFRAFEQSTIIIDALSFSHAGGAFDFGGDDELTILPTDPLFSGITDPFGNGFDWRVLEGLTMNYVDGTIDSFNFFAYADSAPLGDGSTQWMGSLTLRLIPAPPAALPLLTLAVFARHSRRRGSLSALAISDTA